VTEHIGLIATVNTTYNEPFHVARKFVSLDHLSSGRAAWNIVTGSGSDAHNFGLDDHPEHAKRYENAEEFVEVVKQLWDSWEDDALIYDKQAGVQIDSSKVHEINFKGSSYSVKGPLNIPRGPQGHPVLVQAGSSDSGKELAAKTAEVIFTAQQSLAQLSVSFSGFCSFLGKIRFFATRKPLILLG
jgi:FMN-dependent oxidoreductase (nitrilotriacetate monooxygenase family)